jgi:uncharacterized protein YhaN
MESKSREIRDNDRKKYSPWGGGKMGGELYFSGSNLKGLDSNATYVIRRGFGATKKDDKINVYNVATGSNVPILETDKPGEILFGISSATFLGTAFIGHEGSVVTAKDDKEGEIITRLSNISGTGSEEVSHKKIIEILTTAEKELVAQRGAGGKLNEIKRNISDLTEEKNNAAALIFETSELSERIKYLYKEKDKMSEEIGKSLGSADNTKVIQEKIDIINSSIEDIKVIPKESKKELLPTGNRLKLLISAGILFALLSLASLIFAQTIPSMKDVIPTGLVVAGFILAIGFISYSIYFVSIGRTNSANIKNDMHQKTGELERERSILEGMLNEALAEESLAKAELKKQSEKRLQIDFEINESEKQLQKSTRNLRTLAEIEEELEDSKSICEEYSFKYDSLRLVSETVAQAFYEMQNNFTPQLNIKTGEILSDITCGKYSELMISNEFEIKLHSLENSAPHESGFFSEGTLEQIYFSMRMALAELILDKNIPFIFDDPFVHYDGERENYAMSYLKNLAEQRQIILFSKKD